MLTKWRVIIYLLLINYDRGLSRTLTLGATFSCSYPKQTLGAPSYLASVLTRRVNAKGSSARRVHCTPVGRGLDRSRALAPRSPARLARSNDPHPVQCNGIAKRHLSWEIAGVVVVERCLIVAMRSPSRMRRCSKEGIKMLSHGSIATAKRVEVVLPPLFTPSFLCRHCCW